jgi:2-polyprenyl-3-methyl-5-hydroxy-6-metoxy-1,4-benzoquinol methylase
MQQTQTTLELNEQKSEQFAERLVGVMNSGAIALTISVGHRLGLFDVMADIGSATSDQIAEAANLSERYVREWLGAVVTGGIAEYEPILGHYSLPPEHSAWLTRSAAPNNIAVFAQYVPVLAQVEDRIIDCFKNGGGVSYGHYDRFHEVMAEDSGQTVVAALLDSIVPLVDGLQERLESGIDVLDIGCGSGRALNVLAEAFPNSRFRDYDLCEEPIAVAQREAAAKGLSNVQFETRDVTQLGEVDSYDLITAFDAIHDQARPTAVLSEVAAALRDQGVFLMQDIAASSNLENNVDHPIGTLLYTISFMHCMTVSLAADGAGLGTVWGRETAQRMLNDAGFSQTEMTQLEHDFQNYYCIARR